MITKQKQLKIKAYLKDLDLMLKTYSSKSCLGRGSNSVKKGMEAKKKIIQFFLKKGRWPIPRGSSGEIEKNLAYKLKNFVSKAHKSYDSAFRDLVVLCGRRTTRNSKTSRKETTSQLIDFIRNKGRVPSSISTDEEEKRLGAFLNHEVYVNKNTSLIGQIQAVDKCFKTGIRFKYRPIINAMLLVNKPLKDMGIKELEGATPAEERLESVK